MRVAIPISCLVLVLTGCVSSTIEKRRLERADAYQSLPAGLKALVDQGELEAGMSEDAVYIAWGKPDQVLQAGDRKGKTIRWIYEGTTADTHYYWEPFVVTRRDGTRVLDRRMIPQTEFREYVAAELDFRGGALESWRTLPRPHSRRIHHGRRFPY